MERGEQHEDSVKEGQAGRLSCDTEDPSYV